MSEWQSRGFAALGALVAVVSALALLTGVLALSSATLAEARTYRDVLVARLLAEGAVQETGPAGAFVEGQRVWSSTVVLSGNLSRGHGRVVRARSLGREFSLLEATGVAGPDSALVVSAGTAWRMEAVARLREIGAAVIGYGGSLVREGQVTGGTVRQPPDGWAASVCAPEAPVLDSLFATGSVVPVRPMPFDAPDSVPGLGLMRGDEVFGLASPQTGVFTPLPSVVAGACALDDPLNWGSPSLPEGPCGSHFPVKTTAGSSVVSGGEGQGILYAAGDLQLTDGHRFVGVVLVAGNLMVDGGARVEGFVRVAGSARIAATADVRASGCGALGPLRALAARALPIWLPERPWLEPI